MTYFSAATNGFYADELRDRYELSGTLPSDLVVISGEDYKTYTGTPPEGKVLGTADGQPAWVDAPQPTRDELVANAESEKAILRSFADAAITPLQDAVDTDMATEEETAALSEWKKYRVLLMRIDTSTAPDITWPEKPE